MLKKDFEGFLNIRDKRLKIKGYKRVKENYLYTFKNIVNGEVVKHQEKRKEEVLYIYGTISYIPNSCPNCKCENYKDILVKDGFDTVKIQWLDISDVKTYLIVDKQKIKCNSCNKGFTVLFNDCKKHCRKAKVVYNKIDNELIVSKNSLTDIARITNVSTETVEKVLQTHAKHIKVNKKRLPRVLGIDEVNGVETYRGKYNCLLLDIEKYKVQDFLPTRRKDYLETYFNSYDDEVKDKVEFLVTDMYDTYINLAKNHFKNAKIVIDRFHIVNLVIRLFDGLRNELRKQYKKDTLEYNLLFKFRELFKVKYKNLSTKYKKFSGRYRIFHSDYEVVQYALSLSKDLEEAYYLLQNIYDMLDNKDISIFYNILANTDISNLRIKSVVETLVKYKEYIENAIIYEYSNAKVESANGIVKRIKRNAYGFRNFENLRIRVFLVFNYVERHRRITKIRLTNKEKLKAG